MTFKQLADNNVVNNALITQKIQKNEKKIMTLFQSLMLSQVKFNNFEAYSRSLMALITGK